MVSISQLLVNVFPLPFCHYFSFEILSITSIKRVICAYFFALLLFDYLKSFFVGFHVDDSEVTLNVCLGEQFYGGDLFFRGVRCDKHVNTETQSEVSLFSGSECCKLTRGCAFSFVYIMLS